MGSQYLEEGARLGGRYEIAEIVGRGGMGMVYRAFDTRLDISVAVKEMAPRIEHADDAVEAVRQFEREAKLLAQLAHPNLPRVLDYFVEDERWYLIMEFVVGRTLESVIRASEGAPLPLRAVLDWGIQLADVLSYLHDQTPPIVFRDMKPANVMVQDDGVVKLIDFGIARRFQEGATKDTLLYGSPGYSPPEQYGRAQTSPRSDIYALGATLHHLITGRDPAPTPFKFPALRTLNPALPPALDTLILRCIEMDEDRRVQTADEVRHALIHVRASVSTPFDRAAGHPRAAAADRAAGKGNGPGPRRTAAPAPRLNRLVGAAVLITVAVVAVTAMAVIAVFRSRHRVGSPAQAPRTQPVTKRIAPRPSDTATATMLRVATEPAGAMVYLDGKAIGASPQALPGVPPGKHILRLVPPAGSGVAEATRSVDVEVGVPLEVDTQLAPISVPGQEGVTGVIQHVEAQLAPVDPSASRGGRDGVRFSLAFRVTDAMGKPGLVSVFIYGADRATPLRPQTEGGAYQSVDGQLSVAQSFRVEGDPADYPDFSLAIPISAFPIAPEQASYRIVLYLDGRPVAQSDIRPIGRGAS